MKIGITLAAFLLACLWDRDTLAIEATGAPELVDILVGRFDRLPDEHYAMRLERVRAELEQGAAGAEALPLYDDAAVACDRLGRTDEAIQLIDAKRIVLESLSEPADHHRYTQLANLGTFHAHRWLAGSRETMSDLERARDLLVQAIELNPDAHFGRERYQQLLIEELLEPTLRPERPWPGLPVSVVHRILQRDQVVFTDHRLEEAGYEDAAEGLGGLVYLGAAWESPLVWTSLADALGNRGDGFLSRLAALRVLELAKDGRPPHAEFDAVEYEKGYRGNLEDRHVGPLDAWWREARTSADSWRAARNAYAQERYAKGRHPDTHADFWDDWREVHPLPRMPTVPSLDTLYRRWITVGVVVLLTLATGLVWLIRWLLRTITRPKLPA